jgi:hypothetical protein
MAIGIPPAAAEGSAARRIPPRAGADGTQMTTRLLRASRLHGTVARREANDGVGAHQSCQGNCLADTMMLP